MDLGSKRMHIALKRIFISATVVLITATSVFAFLYTQTPAVTSPEQKQTTKITPALPMSALSTILFVGDTYWGRYINDWSMASELKTAYPFSRLHEFNRAEYNAWIANLECPTVASFHQTSAQEDATLSFNCSPDYLPEAAKWFTAVSLANNHTDNRGVDGFEETKQQLEKNNLQYFGTYDPIDVENACEVIALPTTITYDNKTTAIHALPIALCGYNGVFKIPPAQSIQEIQRYARYFPVIVMPHMGAEYQSGPDRIRTTTYRSMIDAGADAVIGNHPHWVQSAEAYKEKLIIYSMGNFIFDQQANKEVTRSAAIKVSMKVTGLSSAQLAIWLKLAEGCHQFHDGCLELAANLNLEKLPVVFTYDIVGSNSDNKITKPATGQETLEIRQRLNWDSVNNQLHGSLSTL